jgi:mono/diheme cytochrome c family protein
MKSKLFLIVMAVSATLILWVLATAVLAQEETPPPYAGLENLFPWNDASAQEAGKAIFRQSCLGCHGANGSNIASADFSAADFAQSLEERADFYFWTVSEGRLDKGMPPFKSSLSEEQRWQVLTYLHSLAAAAPPVVTPPPTKPPVEGASLTLSAPEQAQSGQSLTLTATLHDKQGKPAGGATVKFLIKVDFFTSGLMEIGEAVTNDQGVAVLEYTPRQAGETQVVARYEATETTATVNLAQNTKPFYHAEAGIRLPAPGPDVLIGPKSALDTGEGNSAHTPMSAFRLPGSILSWLWLFAGVVILLWLTYFRVMYQVFRIASVKEMGDTNTRLVPLLGMAVVVTLGIVLTLIIITGPYSHLHLLR